MNTNFFEHSRPFAQPLTWLLVVGAVVIGSVAAELWWSARAPSDTAFDRALHERTIVNSETRGDIVFYTYLGDQLPDMLAERELTFLRTESSYSREVSVDGDDITVEVVSFPRQTFVQDAYGTWHYLEHGTTTRESFLKKSASRFVLHHALALLVNTAYAVTDTIYSTAGGDGEIQGTGTAQAVTAGTCAANAWANTRGATTGTVSSSATTFDVFVSMVASFDDLENLWTCDGTIDRGFLPFDTSTIPAGSTISSATLNVYVTAKSNGDNDGTDYVTVVETSQATHSSLAAGDFDNIGTTEGIDAGQRKDITSISTSAYLTFTLNATGLTFINESGVDAPCSATNGISCFGLREGHDNASSAVTTNSSNLVTFSSADHTGTTQDPYLSVTYTAPTSQVFQQSEFWFD